MHSPTKLRAKLNRLGVPFVRVEDPDMSWVDDDFGEYDELSYTLEPGKLYFFDDRFSPMVLHLGVPEDRELANEYHLMIQFDGAIPVIIWPDSILWNNDTPPELDTDVYRLEVSIMNDIATYAIVY